MIIQINDYTSQDYWKVMGIIYNIYFHVLIDRELINNYNLSPL